VAQDWRSRSTRSRPAGRGGTLLGVLLGLVLGILIALGVAWYITKAPVPFQSKVVKPAESSDGASPAPNVEPRASAAPPSPLPGKPGEKSQEQPRFDFYKMLPGGNDSAATPPEAGKDTGKAPTEPVFLQAGSFQKPTDADNLKARLALMGLEAGVQTAELPGKGTVHRVRLGPFLKTDDMNRARTLLAENGIQATVVKSKDAAAN
jgi:cell division protein FtsN